MAKRFHLRPQRNLKASQHRHTTINAVASSLLKFGNSTFEHLRRASRKEPLIRRSRSRLISQCATAIGNERRSGGQPPTNTIQANFQFARKTLSDNGDAQKCLLHRSQKRINNGDRQRTGFGHRRPRSPWIKRGRANNQFLRSEGSVSPWVAGDQRIRIGHINHGSVIRRRGLLVSPFCAGWEGRGPRSASRDLVLRSVRGPVSLQRNLVLLLGDGATRGSGPGGQTSEVRDASARDVVDAMELQALHHRTHLLNHLQRDKQTSKTRRMLAQKAPIPSAVASSMMGRQAPDMRHGKQPPH
mmetsp:Transcript_28582/g.94846  ORF Transcript_28582/g.94846 Transcript_28582/m.94846 type:complete len:300 (+) Transcript_28582:950-1849(+)